VAFKNTNRLIDSLGDGLDVAYAENRILKVVRSDDSAVIIGTIVFEIKAVDKLLYFGPFGVDKKYNGMGIGKALLNKVLSIGKEHDINGFEIKVVNHRSDLFPMYKKWGFKVIRDNIIYPHPERLTRPAHFCLLTCSFDTFILNNS
jgi:predicted N-acetyltransferase YhbS